VETLPPRGGQVAQHAAERAVLALASRSPLTRIHDAIATRISSVLQNPYGPRFVLVAETDTKSERSSSHRGFLLAAGKWGGRLKFTLRRPMAIP
jgi:hypothetical protein